MFLVTSTAHFTGMKHDLAAMMPEPLPDDLWIIYLTGVFEIAGATGLLIPRTRRLAGICLVLLLIAQFPANVNAALNEIPFGGEAATPLWLRAPMQLLFIGMVWWTSIKEHPKEDGGQRVEELVVEHEQPSHEGAPSEPAAGRMPALAVAIVSGFARHGPHTGCGPAVDSPAPAVHERFDQAASRPAVLVPGGDTPR